MSSGDWTENEIQAAVSAYLLMLQKEQTGKAYNKAAVNRELRGDELRSRSRGSIEMRMCNISSVLESQGSPYIDGYKPRKNVGPRVAALIQNALVKCAVSNGERELTRKSVYIQIRSQMEAAGFKFEREQPCHHQQRPENELKFVHPELENYLANHKLPLRGKKFYLKPLAEATDCEIGLVNGVKTTLEMLQELPPPNAIDDFNKAPAWVNRPEDPVLDDLLLGIAELLDINVLGFVDSPFVDVVSKYAGKNTPPRRLKSALYSYQRSPGVKAHVKYLAAGQCELCDAPAPFIKANGEPYLEVHHVVPLEHGGLDNTSNAVAVCPNCHMRCHHSSDAEQMTDALYEKINRLVRRN